MRDDGLERKNTRQSEGLEGQQKRLLALLSTTELIQDLEEQALLDKHQDPPVDSTVGERTQAAEKIQSQMPFLQEALANKRLFSNALPIYHILIATTTFEKTAADDIAAAAPLLKEYIQNYVPETEATLQLMYDAFSYAHDDEDNTKTELNPNAQKIRDALDETMSALEIFFSDANPTRPEAVRGKLHMLHRILKVGSPDKTFWATQSAARYISQTIRANKYAPGLTSNALIDMLGDKQKLEKVRSQPRPALMRAELDAFLLSLQPPQVLSVFEHIFSQFELPAELYLRDAHGYIVLDQLGSIQQLEAARPGSTAELYNRFSIHWFSRYPTDALIDQYDQRDRADLPYGVFLAQADDHNEAAFEESDKDVVKSAAQQLKELGYGLRILECEGKTDIVSHFREFEKRYGREQKISFLFIRVHSEKEYMVFGSDPKDGSISVEDIARGFGIEREMFTEDPTFILDGCEVGFRGGIAQALSEAFSASVLAGKTSKTALMAITISREKNKLAFQPLYEDERGKENVPPHVYVKGRKR